MKRDLPITLVIIVIFAITAHSAPVEGHSETLLWRLTTSLNYWTGDFGTSTRTNTFYWPFTLTRFFDKGNVFFTVPYIYQESGPGISALSGQPFSTGHPSAGTDRSGGIGDIILGAEYYLLDETFHWLNLSTVAKIKFPTAEEEKGLGTGKFDEALGVEISKTFNNVWKFFTGIYYTLIGDLDDLDLNDEFSYSAGAEYSFSEKTSASLFYEERTALTDSGDNPRSVNLGISHKLNERTDIFAGVSAGLSDGSPDIGVNWGINYFF